jgi:hypothetical protein
MRAAATLTGTAANIAGIAGGIVVFGNPLALCQLGIVLQTLAFLRVVVAGATMPAPVSFGGTGRNVRAAGALLPSRAGCPPRLSWSARAASSPRRSSRRLA